MTGRSKTQLRSLPKELIRFLDMRRRASNGRKKRNRTLARFIREEPGEVITAIRMMEAQEVKDRVSRSLRGGKT